MSTNAHVRAPPERLVSKQRKGRCPDGGNVRRESRLSCTVAGGVFIVSGHGRVTKWSCKVDM
jgi:hypothetical protein